MKFDVDYWKPYLPSAIAFILSVFFLRYQELAVLIIVGSLVGFGVTYAVFVSRMMQDELDKNRRKPDPGFRRVSEEIGRAISRLRNSG